MSLAGHEHILIVDDEPSIRFFLSEILAQAGYRVSTAAGGEPALALLEKECIDLILLDLKMGGIDGLQVMSHVQQHSLPPIIIMLTAHASLDSAVEAMRRGSHDYLIKPCRTEALLASVEKGLAQRREALRQRELLDLIEKSVRQLQDGSVRDEIPQEAGPRFLEVRGLLLDLQQHTVTRRGEAIDLTPTEFSILQHLMQEAGQVVSFQELMAAVYGDEASEYEGRQALSTHIWRLRKKLGNGPDDSPYIVNVRGRGYQFVTMSG